MLVNGMVVDLLVITCIVQGWGLVLGVSRHVLAPFALTQFEMDRLYAGDGAFMYVCDRLQLVTKFVVMCYIGSAAMPLLHWVVRSDPFAAPCPEPPPRELVETIPISLQSPQPQHSPSLGPPRTPPRPRSQASTCVLTLP